MGVYLQDHFADVRAENKVIEPQGMTRDELLEWYMEQPLPFRRRHRARIVDLSTGLLVGAILSAADELGRLPATH